VTTETLTYLEAMLDIAPALTDIQAATIVAAFSPILGNHHE
jgi:hypothetical protein